MFISYSNVFNHQSSMTNIKRNQSIAEEHIYIIQVLEKHLFLFTIQSLKRNNFLLYIHYVNIQ